MGFFLPNWTNYKHIYRMKKILIFTALMTAVINTNAQLQVNSDGNVLIGSNATTYAKLNTAGSTTNIRAKRTGEANSTAPTIEATCNISSPEWAIGVKGFGSGTNGAMNCGLWGAASNSTSNKIYGVFGSLDSTKGAAIYGQNCSWAYIPGVALTVPYAGYFYGNVHVQGNFSYTGTMLMTMPSPSLIQTEPLSSRSSVNHAVVNRLNGLDVQAYYHTDTQMIETRRNASEEMEEANDVIGRQVFAKQHYGFSAEQLEEVFPDLVYENEFGTKSINYMEMVPILVQAIKELKGEIEELRARGDEGTKKATQTSSEGDSAEKLLLLSLGQNKPNPFSNTTTIEVCIPEDVQKAFIYVYDLQGKKVEQVDITARGTQNIQLTSAQLTDGMYLYSLIADGKVVETRRMIVEK